MEHIKSVLLINTPEKLLTKSSVELPKINKVSNGYC